MQLIHNRLIAAVYGIDNNQHPELDTSAQPHAHLGQKVNGKADPERCLHHSDGLRPPQIFLGGKPGDVLQQEKHGKQGGQLALPIQGQKHPEGKSAAPGTGLSLGIRFIH
ncbi:hypothetical protein D3C76_1481650 [compost metagenome]